MKEWTLLGRDIRISTEYLNYLEDGVLRTKPREFSIYIMLLSRYNSAICLCVDLRYERECKRVTELMKSKGVKDLKFFIDGRGAQLPLSYYSQISSPPPSTWQDGPFSYAHFRAMKAVIYQAMQNGIDRILWVEDDVVLTDNFDEIVKEVDDELPDQWDLLYYGANHTGATTEQFSKNLLRVEGSKTTHLLGISSNIYKAILALPNDRTIDWSIAERLHKAYECFAIFPAVALQKPGYSQLWKQNTDYTELFKSRGKAK